MFGNRASILETLKRVDERLQADGYRRAPIPLILLGGSAVLLAHGGHRATRDVDLLVPGRRLLGAGFLEEAAGYWIGPESRYSHNMEWFLEVVGGHEPQ